MIILNILLFFVIGFVECFLTSLNSKQRQYSHKLMTFVTAFINIIIWYYILKSVMEGNLSNIVVIFYAFGWAFGDVQAIRFAHYLEKLCKKRGFKRKIKRLYRRFKK